MSYAEAYSPVSSQIKASAVEVCQCPEGYTGTSCEVIISLILEKIK